jgi:hypothetical protein
LTKASAEIEKMAPNSSEVILKIGDLTINRDSDRVNKGEKPKTIAYEDALKEIGFGRVQIEILFASFLILLNVMNETMGISFVIPLASCEMDLSEGDKGLMSGTIFIGELIDKVKVVI